jgi:hypothetical protein
MFRLLNLVAVLFLTPVLILMKAQAQTLEGTTAIPYPHL